MRARPSATPSRASVVLPRACAPNQYTPASVTVDLVALELDREVGALARGQGPDVVEGAGREDAVTHVGVDRRRGGGGQLGRRRQRRVADEGVDVDRPPPLVADVGHLAAHPHRPLAGKVRRRQRLDHHLERVVVAGQQPRSRRPRQPAGVTSDVEVAATATRAGSRDDRRRMAATLSGCPIVSERARPPVSSAWNMRDAQQSMTDELDRIDPVLGPLGERFARRGPRAPPGRRPGARRVARPPRQRPRPHHLGAPRRDRAAADRLGRRAVGHGACLRHHRRPLGSVADRDHDVPVGVLRPVVPQARRHLRRQPRRRPRPPRLHRQRDGGLAAGPHVRGPVRRSRRPGAPRAADAGPAGGQLLRRPAADDAGRPLRRPARLRRRARGRRRDDRRWPSGSTSSPPSGCATSW